MAPAVTTKAISLVVELGRVACEGVGVHRKGGHGYSSDKLHVSFSGIVDCLGEEAWEKTTDGPYQVAAKFLVLGAMCRGSSRGSNRGSSSSRSWGWEATVVAVSRLVVEFCSSSRWGRQPTVCRDVVIW